VIQKKVCMLGSFAVGKTSLVRRFVDSLFSEIYTTTIGVKIDKKIVHTQDQDVSLLLWDVYGEDNHKSVLPAYLRGMAGYILVIDPTRPKTLQSAEKLHAMVKQTLGDLPYVLVLNKADLKNEWVLDENAIDTVALDALETIESSAKTGDNVEQVFASLASAFLNVTSK